MGRTWLKSTDPSFPSDLDVGVFFLSTRQICRGTGESYKVFIFY